jgi:hypothetical protein
MSGSRTAYPSLRRCGIHTRKFVDVQSGPATRIQTILAENVRAGCSTAFITNLVRKYGRSSVGAQRCKGQVTKGIGGGCGTRSSTLFRNKALVSGSLRGIARGRGGKQGVDPEGRNVKSRRLP